jgi:two-component system, cell cycle response regulator
VTGAAGEPLGRPRLLLTGDASARPNGLERALARAGFHVDETPGPPDAPPDALLTTLRDADPEALRQLLAGAASEPPRVLVFAAEDREAPAAALALGAADALAAPVHLPELCARIAARIRDRQAPSRTPYEARIRNSLRDLVDEAKTVLQPDEIALALVRRLGRALELAHCSYVITRPGDDEGRIIADLPESHPESARLDLARYPEIGEAIRSRRTLPMPDTAAVGAGPMLIVLPVTVDDEVAGVLLMRGQESAPPLNASQLELAGSLAEAAARALAGAPARALTPLTLDRRLEEELERARRYSLGFSLVVLGVDPPLEEDSDLEAVAPQELGARLRRELRLPDFVSRYGETEFAIVLPETGADGARRSVTRLRERLAGVSAGIVAYPHPAVTVPDDLFALVEAALERGRAQGGDRIGIAE